MRKSIPKPILPILVTLLAIWLTSCANNTADAAGKVNGTVISKNEFYNSYRGHYSIFSYQNGRIPDAEEKAKIFNETWTNISRALILKGYFAKYKLSATPREVLDTLSSNIPAHIIISPRFLVNGKFDKKLYLQSLTSDRPENLSALRKQYQDYLIPIQKLKRKLVENELITNEESRMISQILSGSADLELNFFDSNKLATLISDSEIAAYYQANLNSYRLQPYLKIAYSEVPVIPDELDRQQAKSVADSVASALNKGVEVEKLVGTTSKAVVSYIDQGFVKTAELPDNLASLLENLIDGQCSAAMSSDKGWVIYQKLQSTKTLTLYRTIYVQSLARSATLSAPETVARRLMNLALNIGLAEASNEFDLKLTEFSPQHPDSLKMPANDLGKTAKKLRSAPNGAILEPVFSSELSAWLVFEVLENQDREYLALNEVSPSIRKILSEKVKSEQNMKKAKAWIASPATIACDSLLKLENVTYRNDLTGLPLAKVFYEAASAHLQKQALRIVSNGDMLIVPVLSNWKPGSGKVSREQIRTAYTESLDSDWFDRWLDQQVKTAKVIKYIKS